MLTITENTDILARSMDLVGNILEVADALAIRNIDKQSPTISLVTTATTTSSITIKATASDIGTAGINTSSYEYSKDNGVTWTVASSNTTYTFSNLTTGTYKLKARVKDNIENQGISSTLSVATKSVDSLGSIRIVPNISSWTMQDISVTIIYPTGITNKQYKIKNGEWKSYIGSITITENTTITAVGKDNVGNAAREVSLDIKNIDKTRPDVYIDSDGKGTYHTLTAVASDDGSGIDTNYYLWNWDGKTFLGNRTEEFKLNPRWNYISVTVRDIVGNVTESIEWKQYCYD